MARRLQPAWVWLLLIASLAFNAGVGATVGVRAYQHHWGDEPKGPPPPKPPHLRDDLGLSPQQAAELDQEEQTLKADVDGYRDRLHDLHRTLTELVLSEDEDRDAITATMDEIDDIRQSMRMRLVDHFLAIRKELNPKQREKLNRNFVRRLGRSYDGPPEGPPDGPPRGGRRHGRFRDRDRNHDGPPGEFPPGERPPGPPRQRPKPRVRETETGPTTQAWDKKE